MKSDVVMQQDDVDVQILDPIQAQDSDKELTWKQIIESKESSWVAEFKKIDSKQERNRKISKIISSCGPSDSSIYQFLYAFSTVVDKKDDDLDLVYKFYVEMLPALVLKASNIGQKQFI